MSDSCGSEIPQNLGGMDRSKRFTGFDFKNQAAFHKQVRDVIAQYRSILILYGDPELALNGNADFFQTMSQSIFINLFQVPPFQKRMHLQ